MKYSAVIFVLLSIATLCYGASCRAPTITQKLRTTWKTEDKTFSFWDVTINNNNNKPLRRVTLQGSNVSSITESWEIVLTPLGFFELPEWRSAQGIPAGESHSFGYITYSKSKSTHSFSVLGFSCTHPYTHNCLCAQIYDPVCGVDGKTYGNTCILGCAGVTQDLTGQSCGAAEVCICPYIYNPVCGADGKIYPNSCIMSCNGTTQDVSGESCQNGCICTQIYDPVCGADGKMYSNNCTLGCAGVGADLTGASCHTNSDGCICAQVYDPVCGVDGKIYSNNCTRECAGVSKDLTGHGCQNTNTNNCVCAQIYEPVCGTDGKIYSNNCTLECAGITKDTTGTKCH